MTDARLVSDVDGFPVTPETVLTAYRQRCFPMAESRGGPIAWYRPNRRAIITWDRFSIPRSLVKVLRHEPFRLTVDRAFPAVIAACAERSQTWISHDVEALYSALHRLGHAHSVEAWDGEGRLVGGLYGLAIGACFCGESMFHRADDAAKACVVHLVALLRRSGFRLLDCQQQTPHMERFGAYEVSDREYARLFAACADDVAWPTNQDIGNPPT
jgi:leucyl/phenylalanyl-tRNA--protein transferase